jgi:2-polyprenyl-6-hydroxyphenyl methylase / 3-demethylubiquinone-9 3-methyltransferase
MMSFLGKPSLRMAKLGFFVPYILRQQSSRFTAPRVVKKTGQLFSTSTRSSSTLNSSAATSVDDAEIRKFSAQSSLWWDDDKGPFAGLHRMNRVRVPIIKKAMLDVPLENEKEFNGLNDQRVILRDKSVLDVGCGGGILSEALSRLGASVVGIDASIDNISIARAHATLDLQLNEKLSYEHTTAEALAKTGAKFDCVVCSEVLEHVSDKDVFLRALGDLVAPNGTLVITTINRTVKSFYLAIVAAEYVLRIVAPNTHKFSKFVTPDELASALKQLGFASVYETGLIYNPFFDEWSTSTNDLDVNYAVIAKKL